MKRPAIFFIMILTMAVFVGILLYEPKETYDLNQKQFVCIMNPGQFFWEKIKAGMDQASEERNVYIKYSTFPRFDHEKQLTLLENATYLHTDGIITIGEPYSNEINEKIKEIRSSGIPVVLIDTDSPESGRDCYIGSDNYKAGQLAAEKIIEETNGNASIAVFTSKLEYANQQERLDGFQHIIDSQENAQIIKVIEGEGNKIKIAEEVENLFSKHPSVNAFFCEEAASTSVVASFFKNTESNIIDTLPVLIGFDYDDTTGELLSTGLCTATIVQDTFDMGYRSVQFLSDYEPSDAVEESFSNSQITDVFCLTAENLAEYQQEVRSASAD